MQCNTLTLGVSDMTFDEIYNLPGLIIFERGNLPRFFVENAYKEHLEMRMSVEHYEKLETIIALNCSYDRSLPVLEYDYFVFYLDSSL